MHAPEFQQRLLDVGNLLFDLHLTFVHYCIILEIHQAVNSFLVKGDARDEQRQGNAEGMNITQAGHLPVVAQFCRRIGLADVVNAAVPTKIAVDVGRWCS